MDVSIISVNWNSRDDLERCICSIAAHAHRVTYEIIVIDSASFDGCGEMLRERYPHVRFIQSATNLGFARGNNRAFEEATGTCVLFLNPDTRLTGPAIDTLAEALMSLPNAGVVGGRLLNGDGTVQTSCIQSLPTIVNQVLNAEWLRRRSPHSRLWGMKALHEDRVEPSTVEGISGACLMVKRDAFEKVGRFSEEYFMYVEDIDLCHKLSAAGYTNYYVPTATIIHYGGNSSVQAVSTFAAVMIPEAIWRFLRKTRGGAYASMYRFTMCVSAIARLLVLRAGYAAAEPRRSTRAASSRKWLAVLRWSTRRDDIVKRYYPAGPSLASSVEERAYR